jgi:simple sugar transport system substrate-binding protein
MLQGDQYFKGIETGLEAAVQADGGTVIPANSNNDAAEEATAARNMIQRQVDAVLMQPVTVAGSLATMEAINEAGIPLICYGNCTEEATSPEVVAGAVQSDNTALGTATGEVAAAYIEENLDGVAQIGILNCDAAAETCQLRKAGFKQALEDAGIEAEYVADQEGYLADEATPVATNMLTANPEIDLLWASNEGGTVGAVIGAQQSAGDVVVFGTDISEQIAGYLLADDNILQATTGQDPQATAKKAYEYAKNAIAGNENEPLVFEVPGITYTRDDPEAVEVFLAE